MEKASNEKKKNYYLEGMKVLFRKDETVENYKSVLEEYKKTLERKKEDIQTLYHEIKVIKKLKV